MSQVTRILRSFADGDAQAASDLLPLVYDELRRLAAARLARESPGQTLQPTALVHEAYLRLVGVPQQKTAAAEADGQPRFDGRGHFFAAAAEAMRRILIDGARRRKRLKHGGAGKRVELEQEPAWAAPLPPDELLALDEMLERLAAEDAVAAQVVKLHFYAGLPIEETAEALGLSRATAYRHWTYARAWLRCALKDQATTAG